ncbi:hypothetical protein GGR54DRAFT_647230 [Hypoxylon sp. NC1633]|nr:hypothetical protein GGR54DRAFT_647230 [Hypoxylon sp. NC1633]
MDLPRGGRPNIKMSQAELARCPRDGEGTLENPMVIWVARLTEGQRAELAVPEFEDEADLYRAIDSNADIAKTAAIRAGCTVVWIVCPVHRSKYVYDENGDKVPTRWDSNGNPLEYYVQDADPHLTVRLGTSEDVCLLHGHINVMVDERGFPTGFMNKFQRRQNGHLTNDDDRTLELFEWNMRQEATKERLRKENADYELFKTLTLSHTGVWEMEDDGEDDPDYSCSQFQALGDDNMEFALDSTEEATGLSAEFEEYIVRRWSPYRFGGSFASVQNFGFNTRKMSSTHGLSAYVPILSRRPEIEVRAANQAGQVTLLGDASHSTSPISGSSGDTAIRNAADLAQTVADHGI